MVVRSKFRSLCASFFLSVSAAIVPTNQAAADEFPMFSGTVKLACEALLCLSSSAGGATSACDPAISYFYGIKERYLSDTLAARHSFLLQCPTASQTPQMAALADAISKGAGRCDAVSLNQVLGEGVVDAGGHFWVRTSDKLPNYCGAYVQHEYTDLIHTSPVYLGSVEDGGYWVAPEDYDKELVKYEAALEERERRRRYHYYYW